MNKKPEVRYTKGPEQLALGDVELTRADLDKAEKKGDPSRAGWREVPDALAAAALYPSRVEEYGFEVRNYTPPAPAADAQAAVDESAQPAGRAGARSKA